MLCFSNRNSIYIKINIYVTNNLPPREGAADCINLLNNPDRGLNRRCITSLSFRWAEKKMTVNECCCWLLTSHIISREGNEYYWIELDKLDSRSEGEGIKCFVIRMDSSNVTNSDCLMAYLLEQNFIFVLVITFVMIALICYFGSFIRRLNNGRGAMDFY